MLKNPLKSKIYFGNLATFLKGLKNPAFTLRVSFENCIIVHIFRKD